MKFEVKYNKSDNFLFFISNLSEWHFSCRKAYNQYWLSQTSPLNFQEKNALKIIAATLKKSGHLSEKSLKIFNLRFEKIWRDDEKKLKEWQNILDNKLKKIPSALFENLENLYQIMPEQGEKLVINLLISAPNFSGGGGNLGPNQITLEISGLTFDQSPLVLVIIIHEMIHVLYEKNKFDIRLQKWITNHDLRELISSRLFQKIPNARTLIDEVIVSSLVPDGYLSQKYFSLKKKDEKFSFEPNLSSLTKFTTPRLISLAKKYCEQKKPLDENYIQESYDLLLQFTKKLG